MTAIAGAPTLANVRTQWREANRSGGGTRAQSGGEHIVVAATFTADPVVPYLGTKLIAGGAPVPTITIAPYDQIFQVCFDWKSMFAPREPTAIVILWRIEDYLRTEFQEHLRGNAAALQAALDKTGELSAAVGLLRQSFSGGIAIAIPSFPQGPDHDIRSARSSLSAGAFHRRIVEEWTLAIDRLAGVSLLDLDACQRLVGIERSYDERKWYLYRQPYTEEFWHETAGQLSEILGRLRNAAKKCFVIDCDNTLWGGIIGEDGLEGISLSQDFPGSAYRDFQHQLLTLRSNGVMLAICSKNNEADVWEAFDRHDGMVLKREHLVAHRINWSDKASNIESIAQELNIGLDSLVFIDDSPIEIEQVRSRLPMVTCLLVPKDVARLPAMVGAVRLFDRDRISAEDRVRSDMMLQERDRKSLETAVSAEEFAQRLDLAVEFFDVKSEHIERVTQLTNKTNQFNLTTRRKTAGEILALCARADAGVFAWRVADRFGDYGLVGVAILIGDRASFEIETLLMSCRVLGRGVESAVVAAMADWSRGRGVSKLLGQYIPTPKNSLVSGLYERLGFLPAGEGYWDSGDLARFVWPAHIRRLGL